MPAYYMLLDARRFTEEIRPAFAASWRSRSFEPCRALAAALTAELQQFARKYHSDPSTSLLAQIQEELPFDRHIWRLLVGETLLYAATAIPEFQTAPETLTCLLAPGHNAARREELAPIQQAHFGSRDLSFGTAIYRPEAAGLNELDDVRRLRSYLCSLDPAAWTARDLAGLPGEHSEDDLQDELDFARDWLPALQQLYEQAASQHQVVVYELL